MPVMLLEKLDMMNRLHVIFFEWHASKADLILMGRRQQTARRWLPGEGFSAAGKIYPWSDKMIRVRIVEKNAGVTFIRSEGLVPQKRWGQSEDLGLAIAALARGDFPFSTGEVINVDGGFHLQRL